MNARKGPRRLILAGSFAALAGGSAAVALLDPGDWWLFALPLIAWGGLFMWWAFLRFKDPGYYD